MGLIGMAGCHSDWTYDIESRSILPKWGHTLVDATIHTDGAARGNPGPAACAFVIEIEGQPTVEHAEKIGAATNNVAEYTALIRALQRAASLGLRRLAIYSDSELMVKQLNGEYNVKNAELRDLCDKALALAGRFEAVKVSHVRRTANRRADQLCNLVLNGKTPAEHDADRDAARSAPARPRRNAAVDEQAIACLRSALAAASRKGPSAGASAPTPEHLWDQLWSVLEDGGVLRAGKAK